MTLKHRCYWLIVFILQQIYSWWQTVFGAELHNETAKTLCTCFEGYIYDLFERLREKKRRIWFPWSLQKICECRGQISMWIELERLKNECDNREARRREKNLDTKTPQLNFQHLENQWKEFSRITGIQMKSCNRSHSPQLPFDEPHGGGMTDSSTSLVLVLSKHFLHATLTINSCHFWLPSL